MVITISKPSLPSSCEVDGKPLGGGPLDFRDAGVEDFTFDVVPEARANLLETMERFVQDVRPHLE